MQTPASELIDALGGTTAVSELILCPTSTVHSWRKDGIPESRLAHMRLAAQAAGSEIDFEQHPHAEKEAMAAWLVGQPDEEADAA